MQPQSDPRHDVHMKYPPLDLVGDRSIVNVKSLYIATTDQEISVPSSGTVSQSYGTNINP